MTNTAINKANSATLSTSKLLQRKQNRLGPYRLLQTLGEGEFGKVKLGVHAETGQEVAIKLIKKEGFGSDSRLNKVEREISVLKILQHPYIVKLYNVVETDKYIGIILEYASGGELFEYILAHRFLKEKDAKKFFAQLISSVQYMHERNIVHRDLKLENLLLDKNRNIIVTDFGFANQFDAEADDLMATTCGSPCYAAPELVVNAGLYAGSAVDIWSCGVILYAMLCGFLPFDDDPSNPDSDNINQLYKYIMSTNLMFPSHVSDEARDLLLKMLVPDPTKRCSLEYVIHHPFLREYADTFKPSTAEPDHKTRKQPVKEDQHIVVDRSVSSTVPIRYSKAGGSETRKTHIPAVTRDRFAPVTNDKYYTSKAPTSSMERKSKNSSINFAISQPSATTSTIDESVHAIPLSPSKNSSILVSRKPVKEDDELPSINPEKSLSSPISVNENKPFNLSSIGTMYKSQRRGTDKLLSFFTGSKSSHNASEDGNAEGSIQESSNEQDNESSVYQEKNYVIHSVSNGSTIGMSVPSLCLSEDISSPTSPATPSPNHLRKFVDTRHHDETPRIQARDSDVSFVSEHGTNSIRSSLVSFKEAARKEESHIRHYYQQSEHSRASMSSGDGEGPQPEVSSSARLIRGRIAAVRNSIYRKHRHVGKEPTITEVDNTPPPAPKRREPRISFSTKRYEDPAKQQASASRHTTARVNSPPVMASISEVPGKNKDTTKKAGSKMMDWIKKKSQGKERPSTRPSPPTSKRATKKETPAVIQKTTKTTAAPKEEEESIIEIPEHNNIHTRKRANSGNSTALKELVNREKQTSPGEMQIHQGAIDRSALTSQSPTLVLKEAARILRILGIETKFESEFVMRCHRRKARSAEDNDSQLEPIYGDASIDNGDEIRFIVEMCRFKNLPGLYIVDVRRLKGNAWAYKFLYHKLIDFLDFDKNGYIKSPL